jgi:hypothetical protein
MDKNTNKENQFGNDIDRLIAGEQTSEKGVSDKEYEGNVRFAKKMVESRVEPSPEFKENLRKRLLSKLVEQELEAERERTRAGDFWKTIRNLVPRSPAWRTVAATISVFTIAFVVVWRLGILSDPTNPPPILGTTLPTTTEPQGPIEVTASTSKSTYVVDEKIIVVFSFKNTGREALTLTSYPPEIIIASTSLRPYKTIVGGESRTLASGETAECTITWNQLDNEGLQVPSGDYIINILDIELAGGEGIVSLANSPRITIAVP